MLPTSLAIDVLNRQIAVAEAKEPPAAVAREEEYFRANIGNVEAPEDILEDFRLYRYVMTAFDLQGAMDARAIVQKVLEEGADETSDLAVRLSDAKYRELTEAFAFNLSGNLKLLLPDFIDEVAARYQRVQLEIDAGETSNGARLAAYFDRRMEGITSWFQVLADPPLREVVFTALNLPDSVQTEDIDKLAARLEDRIALTDLQDPEKRTEFIQRFAINTDIASTSFTAQNAAVQILAASGVSFNSLL